MKHAIMKLIKSLGGNLNPKTASEQVMFSTIRLTCPNGSTGTGFYFLFELDNQQFVPVIITNKHVVNNNPQETVSFNIHIKEGELPASDSLNLAFATRWHFHPKHDLCFCFVAPLFHEVKHRSNREPFCKFFRPKDIWNNEQLSELSAVEDVIMVGYPTGLWDVKNNFPLFRKGITATHPAVDFNRENIGVVDMACFPGSSGSPIFILNEGSYATRNGLTVGSRLVFLGVLFEGPQFNAEGKLIIQEIPTGHQVSPLTPIMINLGYYIKAAEILHFLPIIRQHTNQV